MNPALLRACFPLLLGLCCTAGFAADPPQIDPALAEKLGQQHLRQLDVRVVDADGNAVPQAKVTPWALRCSQGHGLWQEDDKRAGVGPSPVMTDADGRASVDYPFYRDAPEQIRTISVSLSIDHPDFAIAGAEHIDVPLETGEPHRIELTRGVSVEVRPLLDGVLTTDDVHVLWSDQRSWQPGATVQQTPEGALRIPAMKPGANSLLLVKLDGERATHFSAIVDFNLQVGPAKTMDVPLKPAARITGRLADTVPRPVTNGRIKLWTLNPDAENYGRVAWFSWYPVLPDGTFVIESWPADEIIQLIALCDAYIATSGIPPTGVTNRYEPGQDPFGRAQLFGPDEFESLEVAMTPLTRCTVTTVDEDDQPIAGVNVCSWPNVGWWNDGSQIYCYPLVRGERRLRSRDYERSTDDDFPQPFCMATGADGRAVLELPAGREFLSIDSEVYEMPVFLGRRDITIHMKADEPAEHTLRLQPVGTDRLGEWDKLAGVVFGCSTREGRRICALPNVQKKMDEFVTRFREAKDQRDPKLLSEAYLFVADAFTGVGDVAEAEKWRRKADEQAALSSSSKPSRDGK